MEQVKKGTVSDLKTFDLTPIERPIREQSELSVLNSGLLFKRVIKGDDDEEVTEKNRLRTGGICTEMLLKREFQTVVLQSVMKMG